MHHLKSFQTGNAHLTALIQSHIQQMFHFVDSIYKSINALQSQVALGIGNFAEFSQSQQKFCLLL